MCLSAGTSVSTWIEKAWLPCWAIYSQQVLYQKWIWGSQRGICGPMKRNYVIQKFYKKQRNLPIRVDVMQTYRIVFKEKLHSNSSCSFVPQRFFSTSACLCLGRDGMGQLLVCAMMQRFMSLSVSHGTRLVFLIVIKKSKRVKIVNSLKFSADLTNWPIPWDNHLVDRGHSGRVKS